MISNKRVFVGRVRFSVIGRVGRIKVIGYGSKIEVEDKDR